MIKQKHLASTSVRYFRQFVLVLFLSYISIFQSAPAQEDAKSSRTDKINFPAAVIDMKVVLSKSAAFTTLQKEIQKLEKNYKRLKTILPSSSIAVNFVSMSHNKHQHQQMIDYFSPSEVIIEDVERAPWIDDPEFLEHWYRVNPKAKELSKRYDG